MQVEDLVTERDVEQFPAGRDGFGNLETQRPWSGETTSIVDSRRCRIVPAAFGDPARVVHQTQKATAVAAGIEDPRSGEVHVDGVEHRLPHEAMRVLHRLVLGCAAPVQPALIHGAANGTVRHTIRRPNKTAT